MQLKRIFAIFLAAALIFSVPTFSVGAEAVETFGVGVVAESATPVSTSPKIFNHGDDVSVKISVDQNTGISFLRFVIYFDVDALEYVDYTSNALFGSGESVQVKNGYLIYFVDLIKEISVNKGELLSLNFKIKSGYCGDTEIYTELVNNREANCARYDSDAKNAYVPFVAGKDTFTIHSIISSDGVVTEPVCTAEGYTTYKCTACGEDVIGNIVDALDHDYKAVVTNPTCTEQGYTTHTCLRCDDEYVDTYVDAIGHEDRDVITEPTCTEKGYTTHTCEVCGDVRIDTYVDELGHDLVHQDAKAPTCTEIGWEAYDTCSRCDYTTYVEKAALGHDYDAIVTDPTCTELGYTTHTCSRCNDTYVDAYVNALGHDLVHHDAKAPTCTEIGWDAYDTCSRCDYTTYNELAALGHNMQPVDAQAATCTAIGWDAYEKCSVCGHTENYNELAALGHDYVAVVTDPTCTEQGYTTHTCSRCNDTYVDTYVDALGHDLVHHDAQAATCTAIGWDAYDTCSRCDYTTYNELAVLGHDYNAVVTAPTCTEQGYTTHTCSRCDSEYVDTYVEATGHSYVDKIVYPTISDKGYTLHTCEICSDSYKDNYVDDLASTDNLFPDTDITAWYYEAVNYTVSTGIMSGYGNGNFGPSDSIQRQDFLVMLARYDGVDLSQYTGRSRFTDVQTGSYYAAAVNWGADKGIVSGYQGGTVFGVGDVITREQLVTFLYRYASYKGIDVSYSNSIRVEAKDKYKDYSQVSDWSLDCVMWALDKHVISGANNGTEILPQGNAERCQVAQIMYNIFNNNVF